MGLEYCLHFCATGTLRTIGDILGADCEMYIDESHGGRYPIVPMVTLWRPGLVMDLTEMDPYGLDILAEGLSVHVTHSLSIDWLAIDDEPERERAYWHLLRVVAYILKRWPGDVVFLFNWDKVNLLRRAGETQVELADSPYTWPVDEANALGCPYKFTALPVL